MNNKRRKLLLDATGLLTRASSIIEKALDEEQDCLDNMPENLLDSEKCIKMETAIEKLEEAVEMIDEVNGCIEAASE